MTGDLRSACWRKSTFSGDTGNCVEVASNLPGLRAVRDSKVPAGPALAVSPAEWSAFVTGLKDGTLNA
ncbi:hypothetical protein Ssi03_13230 [Sphaerisporangium siamense]|uniref:DUF397 domain-containing protein n=1 Tax=Sphaerisporangium siamense TaxID=795645 RepID=UPI001608A174|nr:DUF397 domain-containing protein [Sphaerisporangium siamense]GII83333.1 hypothetical protein Ssi03_13230 [Sphaerisporangium siamense]